MSAYLILRAFSWSICLSPVLFSEMCAALNASQPTPLADEIFVCILRGLAHDENRDERAKRTLDLAGLDLVTWPEYLWEWLRLSGSPLSGLRKLERDATAEKVVQHIGLRSRHCLQSNRFRTPAIHRALFSDINKHGECLFLA